MPSLLTTIMDCGEQRLVFNISFNSKMFHCLSLDVSDLMPKCPVHFFTGSEMFWVRSVRLRIRQVRTNTVYTFVKQFENALLSGFLSAFYRFRL